MNKKKQEKVENVLHFYNEGFGKEKEELAPVIKKATDCAVIVGLVVTLLFDCDETKQFRTKENMLVAARARRLAGQSTYINKIVNDFFNEWKDYIEMRAKDEESKDE